MTVSPPPLLQVHDLRVWFPIRKGILNRVAAQVRAVDGVSFELQAGETLGLVGESGCGKTVMCKSMLGLLCARGVIDSGSIQNLGDMAKAVRRQVRRHSQMIFQDPFSSLNPRLTVLDLVTEGLVHHRLLAGRTKVEAALELLSAVGMDQDCLYRYPHEFSGGQRQRISIARALSLRPDFIVCDEPVSALDVSVQAQVINLLLDLREKYHLAYLFISHDLSVVRIMSQRVAVMYLGRIVEFGSTEEVMTNAGHPYTRALLSAVPKPGCAPGQRIILSGDLPSPTSPPPGCPFHPRCPQAMPICSQQTPPQRTRKTGHCWQCHLLAE